MSVAVEANSGKKLGGWEVVDMTVANEELKQVAEMLGQIVNDRSVPKNIRSAAELAMSALGSDGQKELKISTAVHTLDEIINDPNMPMYTRTQIWNIVSILEAMHKK